MSSRLAHVRHRTHARTNTAADRSKKLKEAEAEAEKDIAALKEKKEHELTEFKKKFEGSQSSAQDKMRETHDKLREIEQAFERRREDLIAKLLDRVGKVDPKPHRNLHKLEA